MSAIAPPAFHDPGISALQDFINAERQHAKGIPEHAPEVQNLALQIAHNLRFQQGWTDLRVHFRVSSEGQRRASAAALPRPMISGLPPQRLYVHPDEQIEVLQQQRKEGKAGWPDLVTEREWVLPSQLRESWSLRRFGDVFDALSALPNRGDGRELFNQPDGAQINGSSSSSGSRSGSEGCATGQEPNPWRMKHPKRLLLATLDDDSTVVYYIVHDGIVKPRQN